MDVAWGWSEMRAVLPAAGRGTVGEVRIVREQFVDLPRQRRTDRGRGHQQQREGDS